jgi:capsular exopolysaccharide synthesis family protein
MTLLRKNALWLLLATLAGIAGAWLIHASLPVSYVSTTEVDVEPSAAAVAANWAPNMVTEQQVATSGIVSADAARAIGTAPGSLAKDLSATVLGTSATGNTANVLSISCAMPTAVKAQRCSAAAAAAYVTLRNDLRQSKTARAHNPMHVTLITAATLPAAPAGPGKGILLPVGAILGLLLGIGAIFVRDHFDHRVRDRADLERCLDAPVLAAITHVHHPGDVFLRRPLSPEAEAYRYLRENLNPLITAVPHGGAVLLVASAQPGDGRTSVAANLAAALAEPGARVLLLDAALRRPATSEVFDTGRRPGWSDLLAGRASLDEVAVPVPRVPGLRLVTAGLVTARPAEIFLDARLTRAFQEMRAQADVIVVDSAPVLEVSYTLALARVSDIVAMVATARSSTREAVRTAVQQVRATGPRAIVGVLNDVTSPANGQARPIPVHEPESVASASEATVILAGTVPPRGSNGHQREQSGAQHAYPRQPRDAETGPGDGPGSGEAPR